MAEITAQAVNEFRKKTGLGLMECKALLKEADGDLKKAETLAKERGLKQAELRAGRAAKAGRIEVYIHHDAKSGVLVELNCETDFVARNEEFKQLAKDLALHIMAANPAYVKREDVPEEAVAEQKRIFMTQVADKPANIQEKIAEGKLDAWFGESVLLDQKFVKDETKSVRDVILAVNSRTGENISVARFARFVVGETAAETAENRSRAQHGGRWQVGSVDSRQPPVVLTRPAPLTPGTLLHKEFLMDGNVIDGTPVVPPSPAQALRRELLPARRGGHQRRGGQPDRPAGFPSGFARGPTGDRRRRRQHPPRRPVEPGLRRHQGGDRPLHGHDGHRDQRPGPAGRA